jgi:hypothetical protein
MTRLTPTQLYDDLAARGLAKGPRPVPRVRKKRDNEEFRIQSAFVKLWRANCARLGIAQSLGFHIPNGSVMGGGSAEWQVKERQIRGSLQNLAGVESGVLDWMLLVPTQRWHALIIEFKRPGQSVEEGGSQDMFIGFATARGYRCEVHTDAGVAWESLLTYLKT